MGDQPIRSSPIFQLHNFLQIDRRALRPQKRSKPEKRRKKTSVFTGLMLESPDFLELPCIRLRAMGLRGRRWVFPSFFGPSRGSRRDCHLSGRAYNDIRDAPALEPGRSGSVKVTAEVSENPVWSGFEAVKRKEKQEILTKQSIKQASPITSLRLMFQSSKWRANSESPAQGQFQYPFFTCGQISSRKSIFWLQTGGASRHSNKRLYFRSSQTDFHLPIPKPKIPLSTIFCHDQRPVFFPKIAPPHFHLPHPATSQSPKSPRALCFRSVDRGTRAHPGSPHHKMADGLRWTHVGKIRVWQHEIRF